MIFKENRIHKSKIIRNDSQILGILFIANLIVNAISSVILIPNLYAFFIVLLGVISLLNSGVTVTTGIGWLVYIVSVQFISSYLYINSQETNTFLLSFLSIGIPSLIIGSKKYDVFIIAKTVQMISLLLIPYYIKIHYSIFSIYDSGELMGIGYAILPLILTTIYLLSVYSKISVFWKITMIVNLFFCVLLSTKIISRGYFLSIFFFVMFILWEYMRTSMVKLFKLILFLILVSMIFYVLAQNNLKETTWYYYIFELKQDDFLNGRQSEFNLLFESKPALELLFGSGIGSFFLDTGKKSSCFNSKI